MEGPLAEPRTTKGRMPSRPQRRRATPARLLIDTVLTQHNCVNQERRRNHLPGRRLRRRGLAKRRARDSNPQPHKGAVDFESTSSPIRIPSTWRHTPPPERFSSYGGKRLFASSSRAVRALRFVNPAPCAPAHIPKTGGCEDGRRGAPKPHARRYRFQPRSNGLSRALGDVNRREL